MIKNNKKSDKIKKQLELEIDDTQEFNKSEKLQDLREEISRGFFKKVFFSRNLIIGIDSGKIIDLHPYANLTFREANEKYEKKSIFSDKTPVKKYPNGWRWVDAGAKCDLIGGMMKNCGSTGVMSADKDRTMLTLFDEQNIPHVVATYSPNEKRISGVEGQASTAVKNGIFMEFFMRSDVAVLRQSNSHARNNTQNKLLLICSMKY